MVTQHTACSVSDGDANFGIEPRGPYLTPRSVMDLEKVLGFPLEPARMDPDGTSLPPEISALSPPSKPALVAPAAARLLDVTRIEGLEVPPATTPGVGRPPPYQPSAQLAKSTAPILGAGAPLAPGVETVHVASSARRSLLSLGSATASGGTKEPVTAVSAK